MLPSGASRYPDAMKVREARARYFADNGFGDGGYDARFVKVALGPVPVWLPNTKGRVRSVRLHDLHHVATGYGTDVLGEGEIGAWEVAGGCRDHFAAWFLNFSALALALPLGPARLLRAVARGRRSRNLYEGEWDEGLLDLDVGGLRARLGLEGAAAEPATRDRAVFAGFAVLGALVLAAQVAVVLGVLYALGRALL